MHEFKYVSFSFKKPENFYAYNKLPRSVPSNKSYPNPTTPDIGSSGQHRSILDRSKDQQTKYPDRLEKLLYTEPTGHNMSNYNDQPNIMTKNMDSAYTSPVIQAPSVLGKTFDTTLTDDNRPFAGKLKYLQNYEHRDDQEGLNLKSNNRYRDSKLYEEPQLMEKFTTEATARMKSQTDIEIQSKSQAPTQTQFESQDTTHDKKDSETQTTTNNLDHVNIDIKNIQSSLEHVYNSKENDGSIKSELLQQNKQILNQLTDLEEANNHLRVNLETLTISKAKEYESWREQLTMKEGLIAKLEHKLLTKSVKLKDYKHELSALKDGLNNVEMNIRELFILKKENNDLKAEVANLKKMKSTSLLDFDQRKTETDQILEYKNQIESLKLKLKTAEGESESESDKSLNIVSSSEYKALKAQVLQSQSYNKMLEEENTKLLESKKLSSENLIKLAGLEGENKELKMQLVKQKVNLNQKIEEIELQFQEKLKSTKMINNNSSYENYYKNFIKIKEDEMKEMEDQLESLLKDNIKVKEDMNKAVKHKLAVEAEIDSLESELRNMAHILEDKDEILDIKDNKNKELRAQIIDLESQLAGESDSEKLTLQFLQLLEMKRLHENPPPTPDAKNSIKKPSSLSQQIDPLNQSILQSKIFEIEKLKRENTRLLEYVEAYKVNTYDMESKIRQLIEKYERLKQKSSIWDDKRHNKSSKVSVVSTDVLRNELRDLQLKNRALEQENRRLSSFVLKK